MVEICSFTLEPFQAWDGKKHVALCASRSDTFRFEPRDDRDISANLLDLHLSRLSLRKGLEGVR
jgi:hypothetical protein